MYASKTAMEITTKLHQYDFKSLGRDIFLDGIVTLYNIHKKPITSNYTQSYCAYLLSCVYDQFTLWQTAEFVEF